MSGIDITGGDYKYLYHFISTQIAFGTMGNLEPYSLLRLDQNEKFDASLTSYFMMRQLQSRYIMEQVADIQYFNGQKLVNTSQAVINDTYKDNMVCIRYKNSLVIYVNCNWDNKNWTVEDNGNKYDLHQAVGMQSKGKILSCIQLS